MQLLHRYPSSHYCNVYSLQINYLCQEINDLNENVKDNIFTASGLLILTDLNESTP